MSCSSTSGLPQIGRCCGPLSVEYFKAFSAWTIYDWLDTEPQPDEEEIIQDLRNRVDGENIDDNVQFPKNKHYGSRYIDGAWQPIAILCDSFGADQNVSFPPSSIFARILYRFFSGALGTFVNVVTLQITKAIVYNLDYEFCYVNFHGDWPGTGVGQVPMGCDFGSIDTPTAIWNGPFAPPGSKYEIPIPIGVVDDNDSNRNQYIGTSPNYPGTSFGGETCANQAP